MTSWTLVLLLALLAPEGGPRVALGIATTTTATATIRKPPPSPPPPLPPSPPLPPLPPPPRLPQYYLCFGRCSQALQRQEYSNWVLSRSSREQQQAGRGTLVLRLDTRDLRPVADVFGSVKPRDFPITHLYLGYFNYTRGVQSWSPELDRTPYKETRSYYSILVNGQPLWTVRDMKNQGGGANEPGGGEGGGGGNRRTLTYSLKAVLNGAITRSPTPYRIEVVKACSSSSSSSSSDEYGGGGGAESEACAGVPDPADVFVSRRGFIVASLWSSGQSLTVDGKYVRDHAWCPVQTVINVP